MTTDTAPASVLTCINCGAKNRVKLMLDGFNMFNEATVLGYVSGNQSLVGFTQPNSIVPPRVFRFGASVNF